MKVLDEIIKYLCTLAVLILSIALIILPFMSYGNRDILYFYSMIEKNYLLTVVGVIVFLLCAKALVFGSRKTRTREIISEMRGGDLRITDEAIRGIAESAVVRFMGIREHKIDVKFLENRMVLNIDGAVTHDVNIPEITEQIQDAVTETVESSTGMNVDKVNVKISRFSSSSVRTVR